MKKVLLIEEEPVLVDLFKDKFFKEKFNILTAPNSESGLQMARIEKPDVIILDIMLPTISGIAFLKKLRAEPGISKTPVFIFSCLDTADIKKQAFDLKVEEYMVKTKYTPEQLIEKVKQYFKKNEKDTEQ